MVSSSCDPDQTPPCDLVVVENTTLTLLGDDVLRHIFELVGPYTFRTMALVNQRWNAMYRSTHSNHGTLTSYKTAALGSRSTLGLCQHESRSPSRLRRAVVMYSTLGTIQWHRARYGPMPGVCDASAKGGRLKVLKWARANGCDWDSMTCSAAAWGGHLDVLKWVRANGCLWNSDTCSAAAFGGQLDVLKWVRANGCDWHSSTCYSAALGGHLDVLKWARDNGCDWDSYTPYSAALGGHLDVLKWSKANGCEWNPSACEEVATRRGHLEVAEWVRASI